MTESCLAYCECPNCGKPHTNRVPFETEYTRYMTSEDNYRKDSENYAKDKKNYIKKSVLEMGFTCFFYPVRKILCNDCLEATHDRN
jgi:hypothetical protein